MEYTNEQEILDALERQAFLFDQKFAQGIFSLDEINSLMPGNGTINLNNTQDHTVTHSDKDLESLLGISYEQFAENPFFYLNKMMYPGDFEKGVRLVETFLLGNTDHSTVSHIQRIKPLGGSEYIAFYTLGRLMKGQPNMTANISVPLNDLAKVSNKMVRVLEETIYMRKNYHKFANLTSREKEVITLLALGYQNNEVAGQLFISKATVEQHRKNIKRKLDIKRFVDIMRFAQAFDLI